MAWYVRKSLGFGPFRINLSKSGLGGSIGVKGFRVGTGPGGRYLHAGRGGLYYRARLDAPAHSPESVRAPTGAEPEIGTGTEAGETDVASTVPTSRPAAAPARNQLGVRLLRAIFGGPIGR